MGTVIALGPSPETNVILSRPRHSIVVGIILYWLFGYNKIPRNTANPLLAASINREDVLTAL